MRSRRSSELGSLVGRTVVVTGANSGIGLAATRQLGAAGAHVVMACRSRERAERAAAGLRAADPAIDVEVADLDLATLASVRRFAEAMLERGDPVDVLLNNAGVMALDRSTTDDGFETQFGVNHLGHFALTGLLLPALVRAGAGRVVTVSSLGHRPGRIDLADPMFERRRYGRWQAYFQSKLANLLFTVELQRRLHHAGLGVIAVAAHPGAAATRIGRDGSSATNWVIRTFMPVVVRSPDAGARALVRACVDPTARGGELYGPRLMAVGRPVIETPSRRARDTFTAESLWALSERLTGVRYPA